MDETPILEAKEETAMNALCMMASLSSARNKPKRVISRINPTLKDTQSMTRVLTVWEFLKTIRFSTVWLSLMLMDVGFPMFYLFGGQGRFVGWGVLGQGRGKFIE